MFRRLLLVSLLFAFGCDNMPPPPPPPPPPPGLPSVEHAWTTDAFPGCTYASPIWVTSQGEEFVVVSEQFGDTVGLDPDTGAVVWTVRPDPINPDANLTFVSTPAVIQERWMVLVWVEYNADFTLRERYRAAVVDLETRDFAPEFEMLEFAASEPEVGGAGTVDFFTPNQIQRGALLHVETDDTELGLVYVPFGNAPSQQPYHGWIFELDMDAWQSGGAAGAFSGVLVTTAENDCGTGWSNSRCGGGIWNASGIVLDQPTPGGAFTLLVPTGNGRVDLDVGAYAHSVLRVPRGLDFDPGCDAALCADFDELDPSRECMDSCQNIFIARMAPGDPPLNTERNECDGLTFLQCYDALDLDLGASSPVSVQIPDGPEVVVQLGKDGGIYLFDAEHMGTLYQRLQARDLCGTADMECQAFWAGTWVTKPVVTMVDGDPVVIAASLMLDETHYSGITAYRVHMQDGTPHLSVLWNAPETDSAEAASLFRNHPGRPVLATIGGEEVVFVVEVRRDMLSGNPPGYLWGVRVSDGQVFARVPVTDAGQRFAIPLVHGNRLYLSTCPAAAASDGRIEAFDLIEGT